MAEMRRSFQNVKSLLGKLDRSIDEARSRRLGEPEADESPVVGENGSDGLETVIGRNESAPATPASRPGDKPGPGANGAPGVPPVPARRSVYGRAKPLSRPSDPAPAGPWSS